MTEHYSRRGFVLMAPPAHAARRNHLIVLSTGERVVVPCGHIRGVW